ncbi:hypothetical protein RIF29_38956 [Crotalaria pallida]|uniref:Helicase C-terminal domain-containing protein n=1 Tax=Crotalaria pallida TaxID=3830 RepID=A0AAN9E0C1_CROPI
MPSRSRITPNLHLLASCVADTGTQPNRCGWGMFWCLPYLPRSEQETIHGLTNEDDVVGQMIRFGFAMNLVLQIRTYIEAMTATTSFDLFKLVSRSNNSTAIYLYHTDMNFKAIVSCNYGSNVCNLLVATSIAARGLDVKELELVVNYDVPNHYEDYVHRVGRTGRAGRKGCAITFISEDESRYAPDLVKALELSEQIVPNDLKALADSFMAKVNQGLEQAHGTGYGGSGFKFNEEKDEVRRAAKKAQAKEYGFEEDKSDSKDEDEANAPAIPSPISPAQLISNGGLPVSMPAVLGLSNAAVLPNARWKVTHKETLGPIYEWTGAAITTRGQFFQSGKVPGPGGRKLYLFIEGPTEQSVKRAKAELKRVLEDITNQALQLPGGSQPGKYSVV